MQLGLQINLHDDFDPKTQNHFSLRHTATQPDGEELQDEKTARVSSSIFRSQQLVNETVVLLFYVDLHVIMDRRAMSQWMLRAMAAGHAGSILHCTACAVLYCEPSLHCYFVCAQEIF